MKSSLEMLKKEQLIDDRSIQEKEEKLKLSEIERLSDDRKKLVEKCSSAREGEKRIIDSQIQKLDQKIKSNSVHLEKIREHIKIINNLIFIIDNKKILESKGVAHRLGKLPKSRLDELLVKVNLDQISDNELKQMLATMEVDYGFFEKFEILLGMMIPQFIIYGAEKFGILLRMIRPQGMISPLCACFAGIYIANNGFPTYIDIILAFTIIILLWFGGIILNDYFDYEVDAITEPDRLITSGKISRSEVLNASICFLLTSFIISIFISIKLSVIVGVVILLIVLYNSALKKRGLIGSFSFGIIEGLSFIIGAFVVGTINVEPIILYLIFVVIIFIHTGVNMIGAVKDIEGDKVTENWTVPTKYGIDFTVKMAIILLLISLIIVYIPGRLNLLNLRYMPIVIVITLYLVIVSLMLKKESKLGYMALAIFDMGASIYYVSLITGI